MKPLTILLASMLMACGKVRESAPQMTSGGKESIQPLTALRVDSSFLDEFEPKLEESLWLTYGREADFPSELRRFFPTHQKNIRAPGKSRFGSKSWEILAIPLLYSTSSMRVAKLVVLRKDSGSKAGIYTDLWIKRAAEPWSVFKEGEGAQALPPEIKGFGWIEHKVEIAAKWAEIPDGAPLSPGLEMRTNLGMGMTFWARLCSPGAELGSPGVEYRITGGTAPDQIIEAPQSAEWISEPITIRNDYEPIKMTQIKQPKVSIEQKIVIVWRRYFQKTLFE